MEGILTHVELIGIILTLVIGFGGLSYQIGRWTKKTDSVEDKLGEVEGWIKAHDSECDEREKRIDKRLGEGSTQMALLTQGQETLQDDINEIKSDIKELMRSRADT